MAKNHFTTFKALQSNAISESFHYRSRLYNPKRLAIVVNGCKSSHSAFLSIKCFVRGFFVLPIHLVNAKQKMGSRGISKSSCLRYASHAVFKSSCLCVFLEDLETCRPSSYAISKLADFFEPRLKGFSAQNGLIIALRLVAPVICFRFSVLGSRRVPKTQN